MISFLIGLVLVLLSIHLLIQVIGYVIGFFFVKSLFTKDKDKL
jgi:hypothetical protein